MSTVKLSDHKKSNVVLYKAWGQSQTGQLTLVSFTNTQSDVLANGGSFEIGGGGG